MVFDLIKNAQNWVDEKIADVVGAELPLGATDDPKLLVNGEADTIAETAAHIAAPRSRAARAAPTMPRLSASVPPEVKMTCDGSAPTAWATSRRACSSPARAVRPKPWALEGFPKAWWVRYGSIASSTSGRTGVVAAWSR